MFTPQEFSFINLLLNVDNDKARVFSLGDRRTAESIYDKIFAHTDEKKENFLEAEVEFTTAEKALILKLIPAELSLVDGKIADSLSKKIQ